MRLGVRHIRIFDSDLLSESNITRVYGSFPKDIGKPKVEVATVTFGPDRTRKQSYSYEG